MPFSIFHTRNFDRGPLPQTRSSSDRVLGPDPDMASEGAGADTMKGFAAPTERGAIATLLPVLAALFAGLARADEGSRDGVEHRAPRRQWRINGHGDHLSRQMLAYQVAPLVRPPPLPWGRR